MSSACDEDTAPSASFWDLKALRMDHTVWLAPALVALGVGFVLGIIFGLSWSLAIGLVFIFGACLLVGAVISAKSKKDEVPEEPEVHPKPEGDKKHASKGHDDGVLEKLVNLIIALFLIAILTLVITRAVDSFSSSGIGTEVTHVLKKRVYGGSPPTSLSPQEVRENTLAERARIEAEDHSDTLIYGVRMAWFRVPPGGFQPILDKLPDGQVVGTQCSDSTDEPPDDAAGIQYDCFKGIVAYWSRYYVLTAEESPLEVHWHFHYAF